MPLLLLLACTSAGSTPVLPDPVLPADTLLLREWIPLGVGDRSLGRVERVDDAGCWSMAANTLLWVHDPVLQRSPDPGLFLNGALDPTPWFCLDASQRWRLDAALRSLPEGERVALPGDAVLALRWTAVVDGHPRSVTHAYGRPDPAVAELASLLGTLAAEGVWGQSPESGTQLVRPHFFPR